MSECLMKAILPFEISICWSPPLLALPTDEDRGQPLGSSALCRWSATMHPASNQSTTTANPTVSTKVVRESYWLRFDRFTGALGRSGSGRDGGGYPDRITRCFASRPCSVGRCFLEGSRSLRALRSTCSSPPWRPPRCFLSWPPSAEGGHKRAVLAAQCDYVRVRLVYVVVELGEHLFLHALSFTCLQRSIIA